MDGSNVKGMLTNAQGWKSLIIFAVLALAWLVGFSSRLFAVIRFESIIHEFDPWFNYRSTRHMVENGFYNFLNWFDERAWYPLGRIVGGTVYPGLMITSGSIHYVLHLLNIPVHIRDVCVFLAPVFSGLTAIATYLLTKELWDAGAGLFAACFIAIVPGYISRSVAGSYDNEGIAIFALMLTYYLWIKAVKTGQLFWGVCTALSYFYMVSAWGGYVFIINLIPLHVFVLLLIGRFSSRVYVAYCSFYMLGLLLSMQVPFVGFQPVRTSEHMAGAGVFALINAYGALRYLQQHMSRAHFRTIFFFGITSVAALVFLAVIGLTYAGYVAPWSGRFYSLWDTGYAKIHIPIIASVSEHQPTTWVSFFFDLHVLSCTFPAGVWLCIQNLSDERVFIILYAITATYFAGVMVRLMLTLTPVVCVLSAIAFSKVFSTYLMDDSSSAEGDAADGAAERGAEARAGGYDKIAVPPGSAGKLKSRKRLAADAAATPQPPDKNAADQIATQDLQPPNAGVGMNIKSIVVVALAMALVLFAVHCTWVTSNAYSSPSVVLASYSGGERFILDDFREAYFWLWQNTPEKARVMSWWDYGYQIAGMGNRTTLVDNNTWNNSHIALVGMAMSSNESRAYEIMNDLDVDYVLAIFGGVIGYSGDDINKFLWMVRIGEGEHPRELRESDYFTPNGEFRVDAAGSKTLLNCLMYKMCYYRFGELQLDMQSPPGYDRTRGVEIGNKNFELTHIEEAYTTEHWLVRIYKVRALPNRNFEMQLRHPIKRRHLVKKNVQAALKKRGELGRSVQVLRGAQRAK